MRLQLLFFVLLIVQSLKVIGQDIEKLINTKPTDLLKGKGLSIGGSINANNRYYIPFEIPNRQISYQYLYSGRLIFDFLGKIKMPISFSFTNQGKNFAGVSLRGNLPVAQPFNRLSLKPTYKGSTLLLGTCTLLFSPFTLAGYRYQGVGYEYKSAKFPIYGSLMYGTLLKPIPIYADFPNNKPAYKRIGMGGKIGYKKEQDFIELILFNAADKTNSLTYLLDDRNIYPESNLVLSANFQKVFLNKIFIKTEIASTQIFTEKNEFNSNLSFAKKLSRVIGLNKENKPKQAIKAGVDYKKDNSFIGFEYNRIAPNYKTFGGYFFINDLESFALKSGVQAFAGKLSLNGDIGYQRHNLDHTIPQTLKQWVWAFDAGYAPNDKVNLSLNYSTFSSYSNFQNNFRYLTAIDPFQQADTLNYRQINQSLSTNYLFVLPISGKTKKMITGNVVYQAGIDQQGQIPNESKLTNVSINYGISNEATKSMYSAGLNIINNQIATTHDFLYGPLVAISKPILKDKAQLSSNISYTFSNNQVDESSKSIKKQVLLTSIAIQTTLWKKHKVSFTTMYLKTQNPLQKLMIGENFSELTFNVGYNYHFQLVDLKF